ncbi:MAG: right-handed parallel beta-helix repeat-containing protein [bacterium]
MRINKLLALYLMIWVAKAFSESEVKNMLVVNEASKLQPALDKLGKEGGGILFLQAGTYVIEKTLKIPSNVTFRGAGAGTVIKPTSAIGEREYPNNRVIQNADEAGGNEGIIIEDLVVDGELLGEYHKTGIYGISLNNCDKCIIRNVIVRRCSGEGILVAYGKGNVIVEDCIVEENNHGINIHHMQGAVLLRGNICRRNGVHKPKYGGIGIFVEGVENVSIVGNVCQENAWAGIVWMGGADEARGIKYPSKDCLIANNICNGNGSQGGIFINGTYSETKRFLISANICKGNEGNGIWCFRAKEGIIVNNLSLNNKGWGVSLVESEEIILSNNIAKDNEKGNIEGY